MTAPLLEIRNASVRRTNFEPPVTVFNDLDLRIDQGENVAIIGANGSGKSSLVALLQVELRPLVKADSWVKILGKEAINVWGFRRQLGVVSHSLQLGYREDVKAEDVLLSGFYASIGVWEHQVYSDEQRQQIQVIAQQLQIDSLLQRYYCQLSTGEQRRFLLGRALIHQPQTLVFDEPTSGLDIKARHQYLQLMQQLLNEGKNLILVTHHIDEIPPVIDRVILMHRGKIVADGLKTNVLTNQNLSAVYDIPIQVTCDQQGVYRICVNDN